MSLDLEKLPKIKRQYRIKVGRGIGSGKGKTSGRGVKGQKARTGHHSVKGFEGGQTPVHMRLPKKGFKNIHRKKIEVVNLNSIARLITSKKIEDGKEINKEILENVGLIKSKNSKVKLIMSTNVDLPKAKIIVDLYSKTAKSLS
ncbi:50S ribosomal protein L15 [Alphaproteobacteria bacterium]|nr:50S ribosomal protein L15 [Alphaproteobacteria bacterium]